MDNNDLLSYVGAITGVVGAVTGIAGAFMGYFGLKKTGEIKSLELRLEVIKAAAEVFQYIDSLGELLDRAERSRNAVLAALGRYHSGAREHWARQLAADKESLETLSESFDELNIDYSNSSMRELEKSVGEMFALRTLLDGIMKRYKESMLEDERDRQFIRDGSNDRDASRL